ncbi:urea ABC transporter ATP-binding subunit UrtE [Paenibacillus sp. J5C_2022]|uniref:urea ABC transporter ATP-binding subunit UrtE n=1 Tax=Paenibacillus sp. J5C2022 TaxID=2977129 RepID=UPI0021CE1DB0|nr:urea ABC transporter ATP-binding subunit UrtE [Paenibacillus sp. J5C2022]MCU6707400.1 urea ABC transporter ATP-binding subunit UrtE [Paenibacillus sp. J5C2022]
MLSVQNIQSGYGESMILNGVSLEVKPGQVVSLMGRNGVGKTTLMKTIMGTLKARQGSICYKDSDLTKTPPSRRAKAGIGLVPQGREIFGTLSVRENLLLGLEAGRTGEKEVPPEALQKFPVLPSMYDRRGGDLSGGQQQQLAFARALASRPELLLLDEPTEGIQPSIVSDIQDVIRSIRASGKVAILLVEQSIEFVKSVSDYYYVMDKGTIVAEGSIHELDEGSIRQYLVV